MNEAHRQFVMGVAGVRLWYARGPLPGAAPSPDFDFGQPEVPGAASGAVAERPTAPTPRSAAGASREGLARLQGLLAGGTTDSDTETRKNGAAGNVHAEGPGAVPATPESPRVPDEQTEEGSLPEAPPVGQVHDALSGKAVGFHWRFWIGEQWLLISSCPDTASRGLEDRLAANILRALGDSVNSAEALRWPVFSNPAVPGNDAAGAVEVISAMAESVKRPSQLWLGLEPGNIDDADEAALWRDICAPLGEATVSFPVALAALSSDPGAKKALWLSLRQTGRS
ncbi:hypothetical protein [Marinobacter zhanjiangensis]|uniref:Energy transducer TonB n=1 Tax=Marinobacter zhanjiangensis TaxID=578215 RepID=A0ABQ3AYK1_9GAMM|nr:hypothetical protein [Marinobacter zhanjiangensis]GGY68014.1 hypothetical protein GCM10007071_13470 [Marinobacter zhanjiangensis]